MKVIYHDEVVKFVSKLKEPTLTRTVKTIDLLEQYGLHIGMPHMKSMSSGLFELRVRGKQEVRIIFCTKKNQFYLLHAFMKKTQKTPKQELELSRIRERNFI